MTKARGPSKKVILRADLAHGVLNQKLEFLVPSGRAVAASVAGVVIAAAAHGLRPQRQPAVWVTLPGEPPHW